MRGLEVEEEERHISQSCKYVLMLQGPQTQHFFILPTIYLLQMGTAINRASTHETKVEGNSKTTEFNDTWLVRPTHGWG